MTIVETINEILRKFVFLAMFEKRQILRKIWICLSNFFDQITKKWININQNRFSPLSEPQIPKLNLSVVFKHFCGNS